jgi:branched-chain amino acid transport system permease protein
MTQGLLWLPLLLVFVLLTGLGLFELARRRYLRDWGETQEWIEREIKRREAL